MTKVLLRRPTLHAILAACGAFLAAVVWMDLMFDVQVLGQPPAPTPLPEAVVVSIAAYYRRVTTDADPMGQLVGVVMAAMVLGTVWAAMRRAARGLDRAALLLAAVPVGLAGVRVFPNAVRLGQRAGTLVEQSELARGICRDHLLCFTAMVAFVGCQILVLVLRRGEPARAR